MESNFSARASGQAVIPAHIFSFPLTEAALAKHAGSPHQGFWRGLMPGYAYFEKHQKEIVNISHALATRP